MSDIINEAADVANFAMMVADKAMQAEAKAEHMTKVCLDAGIELQRQWGLAASLEARLQRYEMALREIAEDKHYPCGVNSYIYIAKEALKEGQ